MIDIFKKETLKRELTEEEKKERTQKWIKAKNELWEKVNRQTEAVASDYKELERFIKFTAKYYKLGSTNILALMSQCSEPPKLIMEFGEWSEKGYSINGGAEAIKLFEKPTKDKDGNTHMNYKNVFDINSTNCKEEVNINDDRGGIDKYDGDKNECLIQTLLIASNIKFVIDKDDVEESVNIDNLNDEIVITAGLCKDKKLLVNKVLNTLCGYMIADGDISKINEDEAIADKSLIVTNIILEHYGLDDYKTIKEIPDFLVGDGSEEQNKNIRNSLTELRKVSYKTISSLNEMLPEVITELTKLNQKNENNKKVERDEEDLDI